MRILDNRVYSCENCGKTFTVSRTVASYIRKGKRKHVFCSQLCDKQFKVGENNPAWQGGTKTCKEGYVYVYFPDHPYATQNGYVLNHRLVVEESIGRHLLPEEVVHHKNNNLLDNSIDNLLVMSQSQHAFLHNKKRLRDTSGRWAS